LATFGSFGNLRKNKGKTAHFGDPDRSKTAKIANLSIWQSSHNQGVCCSNDHCHTPFPFSSLPSIETFHEGCQRLGSLRCLALFGTLGSLRKNKAKTAHFRVPDCSKATKPAKLECWQASQESRRLLAQRPAAQIAKRLPTFGPWQSLGVLAIFGKTRQKPLISLS
jgi:hypothetical protein